ncbi:PREDICTED: cytochrome P450 2A13-like [Nanorana parkeri]|uniref:cytochrome P450 2A13-like n=1 Tax=Nanorana parkeri TaxID=125878 RepID=UPI000854F10D|nr:PREDICTED: cytochrome P450 2A13-like [Nanorana parkeri]
MELFTLFLVFLVSGILCLYTWKQMYKKSNLPPGPTPLPFFGNLLQLKAGYLMDSFKEIKEKYGDVFTVYLGPRRVVVLCGYNAVKEALVDQSDVFGMRGLMPTVEKYFQGHGVVTSNGECWKQLRRFSVQTLRLFGVGKRSIEERVQEEARCLVEALKGTHGVAFNPTIYFSQVSANIMCSIIFGDRFSYEDPEFQSLLHIVYDIFESMSSFWGQLYDIYYVMMKYVPGPHHKTVKCILQMEKFVRRRAELCKDTLNTSSPRHLIDSFLIQMEKEKNNPSTHFNPKNFYATVISLFVAGTETVSTTLRHGFLLLLKHPNITLKVQEEIDQVIGRLRVPEPQDRESMPYTDAVIHEIHRYADVLPMNLVHETSRSTQLCGFTIPKGTDVFVPLSFVLHDPKYFPDPFAFRPERFLDESGSFKKNEAFLIFSAGKRMCLGDGLARHEVFLTITTLLQNLNITSPVDLKDLDITPKMVGFSNYPQPFKISFIPR